MKTLLLRLAGPMQAWGTDSRFTVRETGLEPSKSGVLGLLCAAIGKPKNDPKKPEEADLPDCPALSRLTALRMGVRVDQPGVLLKDYHTTGGDNWKEKLKPRRHGVKTANDGLTTVLSDRYYLADAVFLVGLQSPREEEDDLVTWLHSKLARPHWQICLGRKAFVPSEPIWLPDGLVEASLESAFETYPWLPSLHDEKAVPTSDELRVVVDAEPDDYEATARMDLPLSFGQRQFTIRYLKELEPLKLKQARQSVSGDLVEVKGDES